jgi:hypothetical protein
MMLAASPVPLRLRTDSEKPRSGGQALSDTDTAKAKQPQEREAIRCRQCGHAITYPEEGITMQGAHRHTFANPHGLVFDIALFRSAAGCGYAGSPTGEFTWFKGYRWRVAVCRRCITHLGWLFTAAGENSFNGLIVDRLVFPSS